MNRALCDYIYELPAARQRQAQALHQLILQCAPEVTISMDYKMPTYKLPSGAWVAWGNQKHHLALYTSSAAHIHPFKVKYPTHNTGKTCIRFLENQKDLPLDALRQVVLHALRKKPPLDSANK